MDNDFKHLVSLKLKIKEMTLILRMPPLPAPSHNLQTEIFKAAAPGLQDDSVHSSSD